MIELYRAFVPANYIVNDNHGTHYRIHQGKLTWLTQQFKRVISGEEDTPGGFKIPNIEDVHALFGDKIIDVRCEVWRCNGTRFDAQNYAKTFKAPLDLLVSNGYIKDDCWKFVNQIAYTGGGAEVWKDRAVRFAGDNLPEEMTREWWEQYSEYDGDIFIRIIAKLEGSLYGD